MPFSMIPLTLWDTSADWIDRNQLGRRNLTPDQMSLIRGRRYNRAKKTHGGQLPREGIDQNEPSLSTADRLAKEHGVSAATIKRDEWALSIQITFFHSISQAIRLST